MYSREPEREKPGRARVDEQCSTVREDGRDDAKDSEKRTTMKSVPRQQRPATSGRTPSSDPQKVVAASIRISRPPLDSWPQHRTAILALERDLFPADLAEEEREISDTFSDPRSIFLCAFDGDELVGFICSEFLKYYVEPGDPEYDEELAAARTMYIESLDVAKGRQGQGIGTKLVSAFLAEARKQGYEYVTGHWKLGASARLAEKFKAEIRHRDEDYYGTGETYVYGVIKL